MISPKLRLFLIFLFIICGFGVLIAQIGTYVVFAFWATALILLMGHFRHGPMLSILFALRKGNIPQAEQLLNSIKRPEWLSPRYQAYYHFAMALVASHQQDIDTAEKHSEIALKINLLQNKEKGILLYNLARVSFEKKDWENSNVKLQQLKDLGVDDLHLKKRIEELETALKSIS
ncbi:hypothetical protein [Aureispira anguillae]|uniref:Tetratricopeptide repeat protein n=1 Tax=Aureispira anguillae TaxID=2864201 RepID=A0A915YCN0_9BACT|nr:hypothetical protein [Aureispira anguillae]BDS10627.1 hypothetical protein AsAng_0013360 [Aureispira anguillae]